MLIEKIFTKKSNFYTKLKPTFNSFGKIIQEIDLKSSENMLINLQENSPGIYYLKFEKKPFISHKIIIID